LSDTRDIILSHPIGGKPVGARVTLDADRARQIVQAGGAQYAPQVEVEIRSGERMVRIQHETPDETVPGPTGPPVASVRGDKAATATTGTVTPAE
jgi:hypothetical protein